MRLIVEYVDSDECTYSCTVTIPVNAESKEVLLMELRDIAEAHIEYTKERQRVWDEYNRKYNNTDFKKTPSLRMELYREREQLAEKYPWSSPTHGSGEAIIYLERCISRDDGDDKYCEPNVYTVDEWFEMNGLE